MSDQRIHFKQYSMANSLNASNSLYSFISRVKDRKQSSDNADITYFQSF